MKQFIAPILLIALAFSCMGLGLGMIGHQFISHDMGTGDAHECCTVSADASQHSSIPTAHNLIQVTVIYSSALLLFLAMMGIGIAFLLSYRWHYEIFYRKLRPTVRSWIWKCYVFFIQIFSQGVLHAKAG